ncbi:serine/threonine protein kinase [Streptomyces diastatochromogenes]|uniref:Serine/threonine protein kinase n=1 Tax=Streptomyces diastatochromogenes TaxID=42236 RepID=A0A233S2X1_STRDA|nr:serine/threonine protein kinase [Streptomyces diastatochromogenes]OXY90031.1 serine/threonine protein kinase [Streptomyces diastatochromogenes]
MRAPDTGPGTRGTRQIGPYTVVTRLDTGSPAHTPVPEHRFIARSADGDRTVLLSSPLATVDPQRFMAEADTSRYLLGSWVLPAVELAAPGEQAWHARPYLPALPLPIALAVHGGPLPERTVRALAIALAENLAVMHGQNLIHAGVSPSAVLIAADGPRLTCFGAVRAAAPDGVARQEVPGLDPGTLPPEQAAGGQPRPLGDVYALGATLAYAATGYTMPEREELPSALRSLVARCLSRDPAQRPQLSEIIDELAGSDRPDIPAGFGPPTRADALLGPGWLPARLVAAIVHQSASVLAAEVELPVQAQAHPAWPVGSAPSQAPVPHHSH